MEYLWDVVYEAAGLSVNCLILNVLNNRINKFSHIITSIQDAPFLEKDVSEEIEKYPTKVIPYAFVRGLVKPIGSPLKSLTKEDATGVVQKLTVRNHKVARITSGYWSNQSNIIQEVYNHIPFVLSTPSTNVGSHGEVEISDVLDADVLDMEVVHDHFEPLQQSIGDIIRGFVVGVHPRSLQTTEEMLRVGTYVTAVGELNGSGKSVPKLQPPKDLPMYITTLSKNNLIKAVKDSQTFLRVLFAIGGVVALLLSGRIIRKLLERRERKRRDVRMREALATARRERRSKAPEDTSGHLLCVVCQENPKEVIILPCGHVALCEVCSDNISDRCPICRGPIHMKAAAFIT